MGLSIHYSGRIQEAGFIDAMVDEVKDILHIFGWNYHLFNDDRVKGISFAASECEPVFLTVSPDGILCSPVLLRYDIHPATVISVKTQFAGIEVHKAIIKLLRYLKAKYFSEFEVSDEGGYWENEDENILKDQFRKYTLALHTICETLQDSKAEEDETPESLAKRLERFLNERLKKS